MPTDAHAHRDHHHTSRADSQERGRRADSRDSRRGGDRRDDERSHSARREDRADGGSRHRDVSAGHGDSLPPPPGHADGSARSVSRLGELRSADRGPRQRGSSRDGPRDGPRDDPRDGHHEKLSWADFERRSGHPDRERSTGRAGGSGAGREREHARGSPVSKLPHGAQPQRPEYSSLRRGGLSGTPPKPPGGNSLLAELRRAGQTLVGRDREGSVPPPISRSPPRFSRSEDDEEGEIVGSDDGGRGAGARSTDERKRRHDAGSESDDQGTSKGASKAARLGGGGVGNGGLLSQAMDDVAEFRMRQAEMELDADAAVALKSSPSVSGSDDRANSLDAKLREAAARAAADRDDEATGSGGGGGVKSRWLVDAADDDDGAAVSDRNGNGSGRAAAPGAGLGPGSAESSESEEETAPSPHNMAGTTYDMLKECRNVDEFEKINRISEGTYGVVYKAREKKTGRLVALKMIKMEKEREGFPLTSIREINVMLNFHHPNIVHVSEICVGKRDDQVFMVMELMDHDLKSVMDPKNKEIRMSRAFSVSDIKNLMKQMLEGVHFLHSNWVLHRDLKSSNILYNSKGELKICDFGLARQYGSPLKPYTQLVVTLWYRSPELLLGCKVYSTAVDVWSMGCIMGELLLGVPLMPGQSEFEQLDLMVTLLGTPTSDVWPGVADMPYYNKINLKQATSQLRSKFQTSYGGGAMLTESGFDLLSQLLAWDPEQRITVEAALEHPWFSETPLPQKKELMPTFAPR